MMSGHAPTHAHAHTHEHEHEHEHGHGHGQGQGHHAQGSWVRDYESVDYDVPLLHPLARADSDEEVEEENKPLTSEMTSRQPPPTPPKDNTQNSRPNSLTTIPRTPSKIIPSNSSSSSSSSSKSSSKSSSSSASGPTKSKSKSKPSPPVPPKSSARAAVPTPHAHAPISISDDQRPAKPARAYASGDQMATRGTAVVGSGPASWLSATPSVSGLSGALAGPVSAQTTLTPSSASSGPSPVPSREAAAGQSRGGSPQRNSGSAARDLTGTSTASELFSAGKTDTQNMEKRMSNGESSPYGSGDAPRSGKFGSIDGLVGFNAKTEFAAGQISLQNISPADLSLSFSPPPSLPSASPLSSSASSASSPAFFTPPSTSSSPPVLTRPARSPPSSPPSAPSFPRPLSSTAAFRSSPLAHGSAAISTTMSSGNNGGGSASTKGDYIAVPPSSPGPAEMAHAPSGPSTAVPHVPHSNSGPFLPPPHLPASSSSASSSGPAGLPTMSAASSATVVVPPTPGMASLPSSSTVPTLSSTSTAVSISPPPAGFAAPLARPAGGNARPPYQMQRMPSDGTEGGQGQGHGSRRASGDSGMLLRDNSYSGFSHPPSFSHHPYPHPHPGPVPRPELHSSAPRGSMILYRLSATEDGVLPPHPGINHGMNRGSVYSNSGDSIGSIGQDSKYPLVGLGIHHTGNGAQTPPRMNTGGSGFSSRTPSALGQMPFQAQGHVGSRGGSSLMFSEIGKSHGGLVAYVYDPDEDEDADELDEEEEEWIRDVGGRVVGGFYHVKGASAAIKSEKASSSSDGTSVTSPAKAPSKPGSAPSAVTHASTLRKGQPPPPHQPRVHAQTVAYKPSSLRSRHDFPWRGLMNITTLVVLISGLFCLFIVYPVTKVYTNDGVEARILGNTRINATGQAVGDFVAGAGNNATGDANNGTALAAESGAGAGAGDVASESEKGKGDNGGVAKMDVGPNMRRKRSALEQLEVDARRRWERWEALGVAKFRREQ